MRFFFDTEFIEDGKTIDLISIGIVSEDGRTYYAENHECDLSKASDWVKRNVFPHLRANLTGVLKPKAQIAAEIVEFVGEDPEFWAYFASYDWVALCQLYGKMIDLPKSWPMAVMDFRQQLVEHGNPRVPKLPADAAHDALADAVWLRDTWTAMNELWSTPAPLPMPAGTIMEFQQAEAPDGWELVGNADRDGHIICRKLP